MSMHGGTDHWQTNPFLLVCLEISPFASGFKQPGMIPWPADLTPADL
jgi:hypothetical protein